MNMHGTESTMGSGVSHGVDEHGSPVTRASSAVRTLVPSADVLPHGPDDSRETHSQREAATGYGGRRRADALGRSLQSGDSRSTTESETASKERQLGLFTEIENDGVASTCQIRSDWRRLRPCEVVRLLNATPLGPIINDRQLYRHRQRAPWIQCDESRIDLFKYTAWLATHRHSRKPRKRRVRGREVLTLGELREILRRQDFRCALTGQQLTPTNFALDHIVPVVDGGDFTASNSQLVLKSANRAKNTMSEHDFVEMCRQVALYRGADSKTQAASLDDPRSQMSVKNLTQTQGAKE